MNPLYITIVIGALSFLATTGAVTFIFKYGVRLAVVERLLANGDKQLGSILASHQDVHARLAVMDQVVKSIDKVMPDLQKIAGIADKVDMICDNIKQFVPRLEIDSRFGAISEQVLDLSQRIQSNQRTNGVHKKN